MRFLLLSGVGVWLSAWFAVSVAAQFSDRAGDLFPRSKRLGLIPLWTFFAPHPGVHDLHLLYRDRLRTGEVREPSYVPTIDSRRLRHSLWNPEKFRNKVLSDLADSLVEQYSHLVKEGRDVRVIMLSTSYLVMANLAMKMPRPAEVVARQFILARDKTFEASPAREVVFLSEFHRFDEGGR
ncbi:hypothetical protein KBP30_39075 [Streptomyces sp. Go40/10]|uniref:hypothetical protein n=1 Tax=Streptomyces sp. Go40/10 TaxID=2825844 RepID=UPI001E5B83A3|nr:hypothetical protein [Streptomyces sp. Go40/10]UFR06812.1 hypothetical protein KBP30_39075 [Streptomyces sp. Go40/10]